MKLYHYCSIETLLSIVKNETIWFSDLLESNDTDEDIFLFKLYFDYVNKKYNNPNNVPFLKNEFEKARNQTRIYGLCLTEKEDDLSQWFSYAQTNSVAIEFDKEEIELYFSEIKVLQKTAIFEKVKYYSSLNELENYFNSLVKDEEYAVNHFHDLIEKSAIIKNIDWKVEKEWRCYFRNFVDAGYDSSLPEVTFSGEKCGIDYIMKNGRPVFHYAIPFNIHLIKSVTIGPNSSIKPDELLRSLRIVNNKILNDLEIFKTKVTFIKR